MHDEGGEGKNMTVSSDKTFPYFLLRHLKFVLPLRTKKHEIKVISSSDYDNAQTFLKNKIEVPRDVRNSKGP